MRSRLRVLYVPLDVPETRAEKNRFTWALRAAFHNACGETPFTGGLALGFVWYTSRKRDIALVWRDLRRYAQESGAIEGMPSILDSSFVTSKRPHLGVEITLRQEWRTPG